MTANHSPDAAVDDADLIRWLDGELDDDERARVLDAVSRDSALAARLEQLRGRSARFSTLLQGTDPDLAVAGGGSPTGGTAAGKIIELNAAWAARQGGPARPVPPPQAMPGWLRAAAVVGVLLAGSLLVPPVRAWVAGQLRPGAAPDAMIPSGNGNVAALPIDTLGIHFESAATAFTIEFAVAPATGLLTVEWRDVDSVSVESYTAGGADLVRVRDDRVRVNNAGTSTSDYRVELPVRVTELRVRLPGRDEIRLTSEAGAVRRRILQLRSGTR